MKYFFLLNEFLTILWPERKRQKARKRDRARERGSRREKERDREKEG